MINYFLVISTLNELIKFKPFLNSICKSKDTRAVVLSFAKWNSGNLALTNENDFFEIYEIPGASDDTGHFRNSRANFAGMVKANSELKNYIKRMNLHNSDTNIIIYHYLKKSTSFGLSSIIELNFPIEKRIIRIQKSMVPLGEFIPESFYYKIKNRFFANNSIKSLMYLLSRRINFNVYLQVNYLNFVWRIKKMGKLLLGIKDLLFCYSSAQAHETRKKYPNDIVEVINNPDLPLKKVLNSAPNTIVFFTSGVFKYNNLTHQSHELNLISKTEKIAKENNFRFIVKPKAGEDKKLSQFLSKSDIEIVNSAHTILDNNKKHITICALNSTVFVKSLCYQHNTFFYLTHHVILSRETFEYIINQYPQLNCDYLINSPITPLGIKLNSNDNQSIDLRESFFVNRGNEFNHNLVQDILGK